MAFVRTVKDNWKDVRLELDRAIGIGVYDATVSLQRRVTQEITSKGLVDTGNYRRSWTFDVAPDRMSSEVGSPVEYGIYLEYGYTQKAGQLYPKTRGNKVIGWGRTWGGSVPARPHVVPAAEHISRRIGDFFGRLLK